MFNDIVSFLKENSFLTDWISFVALIGSLFLNFKVLKTFRIQTKKAIDVSGDYISVITTTSDPTPFYTNVTVNQRHRQIHFDVEIQKNKEVPRPIHGRGQIDDFKTVFGQLFLKESEKKGIGLFRFETDDKGFIEGPLNLNLDAKATVENYQVKLYKKPDTITIQQIHNFKDYLSIIKENIGATQIKYRDLENEKYLKVDLIHPNNGNKIGFVVYEYIDTHKQANKDYILSIAQNPADIPTSIKSVEHILVLHLVYLNQPYHLLEPVLIIADQLLTKHKLHSHKPVIIYREKIQNPSALDDIATNYKNIYGVKEMVVDLREMKDENTLSRRCPLCHQMHCDCLTANFIIDYQRFKEIYKNKN